jgi:hypothetical protein
MDKELIDSFAIAATVEWRDMTAEKWLQAIVAAEPEDVLPLVDLARQFLDEAKG